ncbi:hypothetical protein A3F07_04190 [candidate division WWE3 bacterium RIFCSPHIGHO2_12_FULL_38_15]|uniref:L,D-TPase catalytic domain-containing protein n=1 Tax=candidate division WWE3 bacterium RIFCSPHIGHO2_02_FULL_38_14 TaxID=1802620 RepID=A0A1F4V893_UNCKA|nr:MAG: hypothetical protein A2793_01390 [candidate division WWE3 bacterium RIFCSPHIGHO2_01_FULL_38_45]OGC48495.1 MAG: hypothetical protein A3F07_04190 [candidate division WWE3 bacterium RIFCSPHIGHO2_12_FULL_38_15]OGC53344.1 MAG: hypothetical protein A3D91_02960 [candidate division WWE3 bacterium RIFCSPHIGHO2_02_FULL_38_14]OGC53844.1 MAG: hypothetical protein A3B64_00705 [candidate division WWE3 bacterium RIFCSPLOWO2_01_FULL_37_24]HLB51858.1 L,D-transpeptidase [Patescibacteria group bacterium]
MKIKLVLLIVIPVIFSYWFLYNLSNRPITVFRNNIKAGNIDLSRKTLNSGLELLRTSINTPIYLNIESQSRVVTLEDLGISYDENELQKATETCRFRKPLIFCRNTSNEPINQDEFVVVDDTQLSQYLEELENEFKFISKNSIISFYDYSFIAPSESADISLNKDIFINKNSLAQVIDTKDIKIKLNLETKDDLNKQKTSTNNLIENITNPLLIKYGRNPVYIPKNTLKSFISSKEENDLIKNYILENKVKDYLDNIKDKYEKDEVIILEKESIRAIQMALLFRATDYKVNNAVILPIEGMPRTNGELHNKYLELIKSQQRLYRFEKGKLVKTYIVSTGLTWETPSGEYTVLGKQKMTISYFGNWYMPNYLPIGYINGQYRFGFHAIPYHMDGYGNIYSRDENTMGSPATGGCIQLTYDESLELFEWANVGLPVYIYE